MTETGGAPGTAARIAAEIRALRKGRGMQASDLTGRMGPNLLELSGHDETIRRRTLVVQLNSCAAQLAPDLRLAITASLGLSGETRQMPYFRDRASWLAALIPTRSSRMSIAASSPPGLT